MDITLEQFEKIFHTKPKPLKCRCGHMKPAYKGYIEDSYYGCFYKICPKCGWGNGARSFFFEDPEVLKSFVEKISGHS